jgi:hypothetical protein
MVLQSSVEDHFASNLLVPTGCDTAIPVDRILGQGSGAGWEEFLQDGAGRKDKALWAKAASRRSTARSSANRSRINSTSW